MNFQERFKGKVSTMNKDGVIGIVKMQGQPVDKLHSSLAISTSQQQKMAYSYPPAQDLINEVNSKRNLQYFYQNEAQMSPQYIKNQETPMKQSKVYTNMTPVRNVDVKSRNGAFQNNAQNILQYNNDSIIQVNRSQPDISQISQYVGQRNINMLDMNEYEFIAIRKKKQDQTPQNYNNSNSNSYFRQTEENFTPQVQNHYISPLVKTYSYDPKFLQKNNEQSYAARYRNQGVRNNSISKKNLANIGILVQEPQKNFNTKVVKF